VCAIANYMKLNVCKYITALFLPSDKKLMYMKLRKKLENLKM